jgi:hypothetical protein
MRRVALALAACLLAVVPSAHAWTWPADGATVLRPFAFDPDTPYASGQHRGVDLGAPAGAAVVAPAAGMVAFAGTVPQSGRTVSIATGDGYTVTLSHLGELAVARGATVAEGERVGALAPAPEPGEAAPFLQLGVRVTAERFGYLDPLSVLPARAPAMPPAASSPPGGDAAGAPAAAPAPEPPAAADPVAPGEPAPRPEPALPQPPAHVDAFAAGKSSAAAPARAVAKAIRAAPPVPRPAPARPSATSVAEPRVRGAAVPAAEARSARERPRVVEPPPATADASRRPERDTGRSLTLLAALAGAVAVASTAVAMRRRRPAPAPAAPGAGAEDGRIIEADGVLRDDPDLLRELDAPHRARVHDDRGRHPRPQPPPARGGDVLPDGDRRARLEGLPGGAGAGARAVRVPGADRSSLARAA